MYSLAITEAIVEAGEKIEAEIFGELPISIVTAIVSPKALPSPRIIAEVIPEIEGRSIDILIISNFVDPRANAASF